MSAEKTNTLQAPAWNIIDEKSDSGQRNMDRDRTALFSEETIQPTIRFFQWSEKTISYGYLLDLTKVRLWAEKEAPHENLPFVQRPTGGGAVLHQLSDLSLSILWPRNKNILPEKPRDCYEVIHSKLREALMQTTGDKNLDLFIKPTGSCETDSSINENIGGRFSACFQEPVCNDVMLGNKKIIGGALRLTKKAILYQGTIQLSETTSIPTIIKNISTQLSHP